MRDGDTLLLTARHLGRGVIHARAKTDQFKRLLGGHRIGGDIGDQLHILARGQAGHQILELKHKAHVIAPVSGQRPPGQMRQFCLAKPDAPARRMIQTAQNVQKRRFPVAGRAQQNRQLPSLKL